MEPHGRRIRRRPAWQEDGEAGEESDEGGEAGKVDDLPPASDGDQGKETCASCRIARIRCSGDYPCARCFRLSMQCRPQVRAPRRRRASGGNAEPGGSNQRGPGAAALTSLEAHPLQDRLVDVVFSRANPRALADVYVQAVAGLQRAGLLDRERALQALRWWWVQSLASGGDASWGFLSSTAQALGFSAVDLEPDGWLARGAPRAQRQRQARALLQAAVGRMAELEQVPAFRRADDGATALVIGLPMPAPPGFATASNRVCKELFRGMDELLREDLTRHRTLAPILVLGLLEPSDRLTFAGMMMERMMTRTTRPLTAVLKVFNRLGEIKLYLFEVRPADTLPDGSPCGFLVRMEACPPSRYVTTVPGHAATASTFRQIVRQPPPPPASTGGTTSGRGLADDSGDGAGADGGGGAAAAAASEVGELAEAVSLPGVVALPVPTPSSISAADEAQLVNGVGRRMYPPAKGPVAPSCPPPFPRGDWALASAAAAAAVAAAVDGGEKASEAEQAADAQQSLGAQASGSGGSPSSDAFSLGTPLGEEETALLKHLLDG